LPAKAVFLDRDGVINQKAPPGGYVANWSEIEFLPGGIEAIAILCKSGFKVIVVTNQRGISTGKIKLADLDEIHARMKAAISEAGGVLSAIYYCPHDTSDNCACRKPSPGMLLHAAEAHSLDLSNCWMVGDSPIDIEAGKRAGCRTAFVASSRSVNGADVKADICQESLRVAVDKILWLEEREDSIALSKDSHDKQSVRCD
jgi:histidinol-phosphate phosphatase family protein